ncbi:MAG TPA: LamG domain-containing protein [Candidatus Acidoferrales bacterium]|nr:LamG domain-containing protein [Candidatus Acidoferrales bacterium]
MSFIARAAFSVAFITLASIVGGCGGSGKSALPQAVTVASNPPVASAQPSAAATPLTSSSPAASTSPAAGTSAAPSPGRSAAPTPSASAQPHASSPPNGGAPPPATPTPSPATVAVPVPSSGSYAAIVKGDSPLVYYRLNETSGTTALDSSGNGHNGTYAAGAVLGGPALLSGDSTAKSASFAVSDMTETATWTTPAVSAECWIKPTAADMAGTPRILGNAWTDHDAAGFMLWIDDGTAAFNTGWNSVLDTTPLTAGKVYHIVGTYSAASGVTIYVNGSPVANAMPGFTPAPQTGDSTTTYLGVLNAVGGGGLLDHFAGNVSDCAVYSYALSATQVLTHYEAGSQQVVQPQTIPTAIPTFSPAPATPNPTPIAYNATSACINGKLFLNNVLPAGEGEFETNGLDRNWWGRERGNTIGGNQYSGFQTSWGRYQYNTYFGDENDGISTAADDPFYVGPDTEVPGSPQGVRIVAKAMPAHLVGNPKVMGAKWYSGTLDTPVNLQYGFFVARVRLPDQIAQGDAAGMSPAFWMLSNNGTGEGPYGPLNGEWDIQEMWGSLIGNAQNSGSFYWNSGTSSNQTWGGPYYNYTWPSWESSTPSQNYHDYGQWLSPGGAPASNNFYAQGGPGYVYGPTGQGVSDYLDGIPLYGHTGGHDVTQGNFAGITPWAVTWKEVMAMFQVGADGSWLGTPNAADFPAYYWVQWIRVYQPTSQSC